MTIKASNGALSQSDMNAIIRRLLKGERATFVIAESKLDEARSIFDRLPAHLRALITLQASK